MSEKINFLQKQVNENKEPSFEYHELKSLKSKRWKKRILYLVSFVIIFFTLFVGTALFSGESIFSSNGLISNIKKLNIFSQIPNILNSDIKKLKGYSEDRINLLLLGMGGEGHDGPFLTDTMILVSYQPSTKKVAMLSIPRDLLVKIDNYGWRKINNVNALAEYASPDSGSRAIADTITDVFDTPIHYYARINFNIFEKVINEIGGIEVYVDRSFTDYQYPADNYAYQVVSFKNGLQQMSGKQALQYSRSRHGNNGEGSDFARSRRQQKILSALSKKILSISTFLSPKKVNNLLTSYHQNIQTNIEIWEALILKKSIKNFDENVVNQILDTSPENYLFEDIVNGAYVLQPKAGDWSDLRYLADNIFDANLTAKEMATIEVLNGTKLPGLALNTGIVLQNFGYDVIRMRNAINQTVKKTQIYDLSGGTKKKTVRGLKNQFKASVSISLPFWLEKWQSDNWDGEDKVFTKADIVVVAGQDIAYSINRQIEIWNKAQESDQEEEEVDVDVEGEDVDVDVDVDVIIVDEEF